VYKITGGDLATKEINPLHEFDIYNTHLQTHKLQKLIYMKWTEH